MNDIVVKIFQILKTMNLQRKISEASKGNQYRKGKQAWNKGKYTSEVARKKNNQKQRKENVENL